MDKKPELKTLLYKHQEHRRWGQRWELLEAMVAGGRKMTPEMKRRLMVNPDGREEGVIEQRLKLATYENKIGPVIGRFVSQLCHKEGLYEGSKDDYWAKFKSQQALLPGDDDGRTSFHLFLQAAILSAMSTGKAIAQVDCRVATGVGLDGQKKNGELEPYVILHPRSCLWDFEPADEGGFKYVKLHQFIERRQKWDKEPIRSHIFTIFEQEEGSERILASKYRVTCLEEEKAGSFADLETFRESEVQIEVVDGIEGVPIFNVNGKYRFPVISLNLPDSLCIAEQLFDLQKSYFNQTAGLEWGMYTSNCAMPVISGVDDDEDDPFLGQKIGEGFYITLKTGQNLSWTERPGGAFGITLNYRGEISRSIYAVLQQVAIAADSGTAIIARSGESKKEDRRPEQILLEVYGEMLRVFAKQIWDCAAIAHNEDIEFTVSGFDDFLSEGLLEYVTGYANSSQLLIPSITFKKAMAKYSVRRILKEVKADPAEIEQAIQEIEAAEPEEFQPPQPQQ